MMWLPRFVCPDCRRPVGPVEGAREGWACRECGHQFSETAGVLGFLTPQRRLAAQPFAEQYRLVRECEGYRSEDPAYYCTLPYVSRGDRHFAQWGVRRSSYETLLGELESVRGGRVLDLGAGNGWLSYRLALAGYIPVAVDRLADEADGLGASRHYPVRFPAVQADFDALPFEDRQFDVVVLNGALHYAPDPEFTLRQLQRLLAPGGRTVVMDSPMFARDADGRLMVADLRHELRTRYGLESPVEPGVGYLTYEGLNRAACRLGLTAEFVRSRGPWWWQLGRQASRVRLGRAPAAFGLWVAR